MVSKSYGRKASCHDIKNIDDTMKQVRPGRKQPSIAGASFFLVTAYTTSSSCSALSLPRGPQSFRNAGRGSDLGGGGKSPPWNRLNFHCGDEDNDDLSIFNIAQFWMVSLSDDGVDEYTPSTIDDQSTQDTTVLRTRGGDAAVKQKPPSSNNRNIVDSVNDALDSLQKLMLRPFQIVGQRIPSSLLSKKKGETSSAKDQEQVLRSTKVQSVTAPESALLPPDIITQSATDSELIGGTLNPEALELTATAINRWYADNGYVLNSVTGATLIPSATDDDGGKSSSEGRVELKVKEVKLARVSQNSSFPVKLRLVERVDSENDTNNDQSSLITLPSQLAEQSTFKTISGCTRPEKIARMTKLEPGSHLRIIPDRWSKLVAFPGGIFGAGGSRSAIFSTIHAVRPIPEDSSQGNTVSLEIIASENKPYAALEYGVTKSLYSDKWEGEFDLKHTNAFGGGEVATINVRKGQSNGRGNDRNIEKETNNKWAQRLNDGPLSWRMSVKDSYAGYDLNLFHDNVGSGGRRKKQQIAANEEAESGVLSDDSGGNPMRVGGTMRLRLPSSMKRKLKASVVSATFERINAQSIASASVGVGPFRLNPFHSLQSLLSASITSGVRSNSDESAGLVPYAAGTLTSHQIMPLGSHPVNVVVRHVASGGTKNLPRHEAVSLGLSSKVRGYNYNYRSQTAETSSNEEEKQQELGVWQALKKICCVSNCASVRPSIATAKALSGTMELRLPFNAASEGLQPILSGTFLLFGDWSLTQAHTPSAATESENRHIIRCSSAGVGMRTVVQGIPLKVDACITEHGSRGVFFGIGGHEFS